MFKFHSVGVINHIDQRNLLEERVYFGLPVIVHHVGKSGQELEEIMEECYLLSYRSPCVSFEIQPRTTCPSRDADNTRTLLNQMIIKTASYRIHKPD